MRHTRRLGSLRALLVAGALALSAPLAPALGQERPFEEGYVLVDAAAGVGASELEAALGRVDGIANQHLDTGEVADGYVRVALEPGADPVAVSEELGEVDGVQAAQPNWRYALVDSAERRGIGALSEDLHLGAFAHSLSDPMAGEQWGLASIGALEAWDTVRTSGQVTVAVFDLGFETTHPDLAPNIAATYNSYNAARGQGSTTDVTPAVVNPGHGTHVAGIISAVADNEIGVAGASYNARILPIKVVAENGEAYADALIDAYDYVLAHKADLNIRVINISLGTKVASIADDAFLQKISEAWDAGIVTVAASGNAHMDEAVPYCAYPGDYERVVSVIGLRDDGDGPVRHPSSNYNWPGERTKDIGAPGANILSTVEGASYGYNSGTSMAAPYVSGVLALVFAANPSLTAQQATDILYRSATDLGPAGFDDETGWGEVNAAAAVRAARGENGKENNDQPTPTGKVSRIAGADRLQTAIAVSQAGFEHADWVVVASGENFPDALTASVLAGVRGCPILITPADVLPTEVAAEAARLGARSAFVVGGASAVSDAVVAGLEAGGITCERVWGASRQDTAVAALYRAAAIDPALDTVIVATGSSFPDSLSAGSYAYAAHAPILLADASGLLGQGALDALAQTPQIRHVLVVGGASSVGSVETQLGAGYSVERVAGANRYETSAQVASWAASHGLSYAGACVATGASYPDALTGAALAGRRGSVLLLAHDATDPTVALLATSKAGVSSLAVLGGEGSVSGSLLAALEAALA